MKKNHAETDLMEGELISSLEGSNALMLPGKKKKGIGKCSKKKRLQAPAISKTKLRKLKKIQEEKEKKLLHIKSIQLLEKHKISEGVFSLLRSSGTIGQAETAKEKRRLAVQLSKTGLEVPENLSPKKKKAKHRNIGDEVILNVEPAQNVLQNECINNSEIAKRMEFKSCDDSLLAQNPLETTVAPSQKLICKDNVSEDLNDAPSNSCSYADRDNIVQGKHDLASKVKHTETSSNFEADRNTTGPLVVQVTRPKEVEETRKGLPIIMMEQEIMEAISNHSVIILCGETGCGKTTQVPQFLYEAGYGSKCCDARKGMIGVTQPRRVAAIATAKRVSFELGFKLGEKIGYQVRHDKMIRDGSCSIKFMTDGILLREIQSDFLLRRYSVIILDEAHERSLNTDILVGMLSRVVKLREKLYLEQRERIRSGVKIDPEMMITQLKLVLMSATLRIEDFISDKKLFHVTPPIIEVPVRQYAVKTHYAKKTHDDYLGQAYKKVMLIHKKLPPGGILVFVTGQREVEVLCKKICNASKLLIANKSKVSDALAAGSTNIDMDLIEETKEFEPRDMFNSFDENDSDNENDPEIETDSSLSETDTDFEDEFDGGLEKTDDIAFDLLNDSASLSALKASFDAFSKKPSKENTSIQEDSESQKKKRVRVRKVKPITPIGPLHVLPLYAMLPTSAQDLVFKEVPEGERLVVVSTNVAETSLTIPGIKYVVDSGKEKVKLYNFANGIESYEVQWISKASAAQRAGRAGRTGPGHCYRLYSSAAFSKDDLFPKFKCPEISKIPVDGVVLFMKSIGIDKVANFPFPTPPETKAITEAENCLKVLEALDSQGKLTQIGRAMAQYPMSPRHSRMLLTVIQFMNNQDTYSRANLLLAYAIATVSALSFPNPCNHTQFDVDNPNQDQESKKSLKKAKSMVKEARTKFINPSSDALTFAHALQLFELAERPYEFCQIHGLHHKTMQDMSKLRAQLLKLIFFQSKFSEEFRWDHSTVEEVEKAWKVEYVRNPLSVNEEEILGQAICAGWADRVAKRIRKIPVNDEVKTRAVRYQSCALDETVYLHRWSSLSNSAPEFVVYTELLETNRPYMHGATAVKSNWLVKYASSLCTFSAPFTDPKPYYDPLADQTLCWVTPLFGRHNWQLPLYSMPIENEELRISVFASALLDGSVLPCMKMQHKCLAMPSSTLLKNEALGQKRVGNLLNALKIGSEIIDSRLKLKETWSENPKFLYLEIKNWFQAKYHDRFENLWKEMLSEVNKEGEELFPKRAKMSKRRKK